MSCPKCGMPESEHKFPYALDGQDYSCHSYVKFDGSFHQSKPCKKIAKLREMLLECLPCVQDCIDCVAYKESGREKIAGLAKRIENEVQE